jgi:hypothetical protein
MIKVWMAVPQRLRPAGTIGKRGIVDVGVRQFLKIELKKEKFVRAVDSCFFALPLISRGE